LTKVSSFSIYYRGYPIDEIPTGFLIGIEWDNIKNITEFIDKCIDLELIEGENDYQKKKTNNYE